MAVEHGFVEREHDIQIPLHRQPFYRATAAVGQVPEPREMFLDGSVTRLRRTAL